MYVENDVVTHDAEYSTSFRMIGTKLKRRQAAGWKVGSARDFLKLSDEEAALVEAKVLVTGALRQARARRGLSQASHSTKGKQT